MLYEKKAFLKADVMYTCGAFCTHSLTSIIYKSREGLIVQIPNESSKFNKNNISFT